LVILSILKYSLGLYFNYYLKNILKGFLSILKALGCLCLSIILDIIAHLEPKVKHYLLLTLSFFIRPPA